MPGENGLARESDIRATTDPPEPEWESSIAPQGYAPELVDEIAEMETPGQQRRKVIRWAIFTLLLIVATIWLCIPRNADLPTGDPAPYNIGQRPRPPMYIHLTDLVPETVGDFKLVRAEEKQFFEDPYIGALGVVAAYVDADLNPVQVILIDAKSDINARRYLQNYKVLLVESVRDAEVKDLIWLDHSYVQWQAPSFADRAYGLAWSNNKFFIAVTAPSQTAQENMAALFPY